MTTTAPPLTLAEAVLAVGAVYAYADEAAKMKTQARETIARDYLSEGARMPIRDPRDGTKIGTLTVTEPAPVAEVDDEDALLDYIEYQYPEAIAMVTGVVNDGRGYAHAQILEVLAEHAPHLLREPQRVAADWARAEVLGKAAASGDPIPGVSVRTKRGHATVRPAEGSLEKYRELVAGGHVDPLRELPVAAPATETGEA